MRLERCQKPIVAQDFNILENNWCCIGLDLVFIGKIVVYWFCDHKNVKLTSLLSMHYFCF